MGTTSTLVTLEEYLNTSYEPDMDFVDGVLVRRNVGTPSHGRLQTRVIVHLDQFRESRRIEVFTETRLRVTKTGRHRIPDVMVVAKPFHKGKAIWDVPAIIVEIKSPEDTLDDILDRCFEYEALGVLNILVMDPDHRLSWFFEHGGFRVLTGDSVSLTLPDRPAIEFPFGAMFAELDEE